MTNKSIIINSPYYGPAKHWQVVASTQPALKSSVIGESICVAVKIGLGNELMTVKTLEEVK